MAAQGSKCHDFNRIHTADQKHISTKFSKYFTVVGFAEWIRCKYSTGSDTVSFRRCIPLWTAAIEGSGWRENSVWKLRIFS